jgi:hypothetical protein
MAVLYHGTASNFTEFDPHYTLRGSEPNSGLGIHLTERPELAARYAVLATKDIHGGEPVVLVVEADVKKIGMVTRVDDYLGREVNSNVFEDTRTREEFVLKRLELQAAGFDGVATDTSIHDDLSGCWAIFDASKLSVVARLSVAEASELEADAFYPDIEFEDIDLFEDEKQMTWPS